MLFMESEQGMMREKGHGQTYSLQSDNDVQIRLCYGITAPSEGYLEMNSVHLHLYL